MAESSRSARRLQRQALLLLPWAVATFLLGVLGQQLPHPVWAALSATLAGASVAVFVALLAVVAVASSYSDDRHGIESKYKASWPYVARAATWGVASAGIGALLATALPARISSAQSGPNELPVAGWLAIAFGALGIALAILDEWHRRQEAEALGIADKPEVIDLDDDEFDSGSA
jgi:hypothetical protein